MERYGEDNHFVKAIHNYYESLCGFAYKYVGDWDQARDAVLRAYEELKRAGQDFSVEWIERKLKAATRNNCTDCLRKNGRERKRHEQYLRDNGNPEYDDGASQADETKAELFKLIREKLEGLPAEQRRAVGEFYLKGKNTRELARELGITTSTVNQNRYKGVKTLRDILTDRK